MHNDEARPKPRVSYHGSGLKVFQYGSTSGSAWKYGVLCVASICLSNLGVTLLTKIGMARWVAKLLCDTVLYFVNYHFQQVWVFRPERKEGSRK